VPPEAITADPEKLRAVREWPIPKNKHKIRSFLDIYMYYRLFIFGFANITTPLTKLMEEKQATPEVEANLQTLKQALCAAPILAYQCHMTICTNYATTAMFRHFLLKSSFTIIV
jgi:hypothetical protein